jgi:hypothetical protein
VQARAARFSKHTATGPAKDGPLTEEAIKLNILRIASHPDNNSGKSTFLLQTYKDFTIEAKRKNLSVPFSKGLIDTAFRISVSRLSKQVSTPYQRDRQTMIDRVSSVT